MFEARLPRLDTFRPIGPAAPKQPSGSLVGRWLSRSAPIVDRATAADQIETLLQSVDKDFDADTRTDARAAAMVMLSGGISARSTAAASWLGLAVTAIVAAGAGRRVHVIFARRDRLEAFETFTKTLFDAAEISPGVLQAGQGAATRRSAHAAPVVLGPVSLFGADYLRDARIRKRITSVSRWRLDRLKGQGARSRGLIGPPPDIGLFEQAVTLLVENAGSSLSVSERSRGLPELDIADTSFGLAAQLQDGADFVVSGDSVRLTGPGSRRLRVLSGALDGRWSNAGFREAQVRTALAALYLLDKQTDIQIDRQTGALHLSNFAQDVLGEQAGWFARRLLATGHGTDVAATIPLQRWAKQYTFVAGTGLAPKDHATAFKTYGVWSEGPLSSGRAAGKAACRAADDRAQMISKTFDRATAIMAEGLHPVVVCPAPDTARELQAIAQDAQCAVSVVHNVTAMSEPYQPHGLLIVTDASPGTLRRIAEWADTRVVLTDAQKLGVACAHLAAACGNTLDRVFWCRDDPFLKSSDSIPQKLTLRRFLEQMRKASDERAEMRARLLAQHARLDSLLAIAGERE